MFFFRLQYIVSYLYTKFNKYSSHKKIIIQLETYKYYDFKIITQYVFDKA